MGDEDEVMGLTKTSVKKEGSNTATLPEAAKKRHDFHSPGLEGRYFTQFATTMSSLKILARLSTNSILGI